MKTVGVKVEYGARAQYINSNTVKTCVLNSLSYVKCIMPERGYFSFRYSIPGYTFILLVIAVNIVPLLTILSDASIGPFFGAFLAFVKKLTEKC